MVATLTAAASTGDHAAAIDQLPDPVDLDRDLIAVGQEAWWVAEDPDATGRPGRDDVAGFEGHEPRAEGDQARHVVDHLGGAGILDGLAVDEAADAQRARIGQVVGGDEPRPERAERVEALPAYPLAVAELEIPGRHVVEARVPEHVIQRPRRGYVTGTPADHDGELGLVVDLAGVG